MQKFKNVWFSAQDVNLFEIWHLTFNEWPEFHYIIAVPLVSFSRFRYTITSTSEASIVHKIITLCWLQKTWFRFTKTSEFLVFRPSYDNFVARTKDDHGSMRTLRHAFQHEGRTRKSLNPATFENASQFKAHLNWAEFWKLVKIWGKIRYSPLALENGEISIPQRHNLQKTPISRRRLLTSNMRLWQDAFVESAPNRGTWLGMYCTGKVQHQPFRTKQTAA